MSQIWIFQSNMSGVEVEAQSIVRALKGLALTWAAVPVRPFEEELRIFPWDGPRVFYGSTKMVKLAAKIREEADPLWYDETTYKPSVWGRALGKHYINHDATYTTIDNLLAQAAPEVRGEVFVRPDADLKAFIGQVIDLHDAEKSFSQWSNGWAGFDRSLPVVIAPVKEILQEARVWMVDGEPVAAAMYRSCNRRVSAALDLESEDQRSLVEFAREQDKTLSPMLGQVYVLDIAQVGTAGAREMKVVEINSFHASGFYQAACVLPVLRAVSDHVAKNY